MHDSHIWFVSLPFCLYFQDPFWPFYVAAVVNGHNSFLKLPKVVFLRVLFCHLILFLSLSTIILAVPLLSTDLPTISFCTTPYDLKIVHHHRSSPHHVIMQWHAWLLTLIFSDFCRDKCVVIIFFQNTVFTFQFALLFQMIVPSSSCCLFFSQIFLWDYITSLAKAASQQLGMLYRFLEHFTPRSCSLILPCMGFGSHGRGCSTFTAFLDRGFLSDQLSPSPSYDSLLG